MLNSACFYLTLSARKVKARGSSFKHVGALWFTSARRACRPSERKVIGDLQFFFFRLEHHRWERKKSGVLLLKVFFHNITTRYFLNFLIIFNHFPCRIRISSIVIPPVGRQAKISPGLEMGFLCAYISEWLIHQLHLLHQDIKHLTILLTSICKPSAGEVKSVT